MPHTITSESIWKKKTIKWVNGKEVWDFNWINWMSLDCNETRFLVFGLTRSSISSMRQMIRLRPLRLNAEKTEISMFVEKCKIQYGNLSLYQWMKISSWTFRKIMIDKYSWSCVFFTNEKLFGELVLLRHQVFCFELR